RHTRFSRDWSSDVCSSDLPFQRTTELSMKFVPVTVSVSASLPASALDGSSIVIVGTGFTAGLIVKVLAAEVPPPGAGFDTATCADRKSVVQGKRHPHARDT